MLFLSFAAALPVGLLLCLFLWKIRLPSRFLDADITSVQKVHSDPKVARVGGIAVCSGLVVGALFYPELGTVVFLSLPILALGLWEDITKSVPPLARLLVSFAVAAVACFVLDAGFYRSGWDDLDTSVLYSPWAAYTIATFMTAGVVHAMNIIDGYNGLMLGCAAMVAAALLSLALLFEDTQLILLLSFLLIGILVLFVFNYPRGLIFAGDGGAYFIGFFLALASLLLVNRHTEVSPWFPLLLLSYPVWETLFSVWRRVFVYGTSPGKPDHLHMHSLTDLFLAEHLPAKYAAASRTLVAPGMWLLALFGIIPALLFWHNTPVLIGFAGFFVVLYWLLYRVLFQRTKRIRAGHG